MSDPLTFGVADAADADALVDLVRRAYRGDESRAGWTTEADLLGDERIDRAGMLGKITAPDSVVVTVHDAATLIACCEVVRKSADLAYFGMFAVEPSLQAAGLGRRILAEAERYAVADLGVRQMEMTVIAQRTELIDWYVRRGYTRTDERREFPYDQLVNGEALRDDLYFIVLGKVLQAGPAI